MNIDNEPVATWEERCSKEAPPEYIEEILWKIYPNALEIGNFRSEHKSGVDWKVHFETGGFLEIDDKNDLWLGITGNISLDEKTTDKNCSQLFVNYPKFKGNYILIHNNLLRQIDLDKYTIRWWEEKQPWGGYTRTRILKVEALKHSMYRAFPLLVNPSIDWFTHKRKSK